MGSPPSVDAWLPLVYDCLRELAGQALRRERAAHTLQPTALAHEAYLRLAGGRAVDCRDETHFLAIAAHAVREVLVDHARRRQALKRGGDRARVTLALGDVLDREQRGGADVIDLLALDEALVTLATLNARAARVVELRFFSGLSIDETARALGVSSGTVDVDWRFARAWLSRELEGGDS